MSEFFAGQLLGWFEALGGAVILAIVINWRRNKDDEF